MASGRGLVEGAGARRILGGLGAAYLLAGSTWAATLLADGRPPLAVFIIGLLIAGPGVGLLYGSYSLPETEIGDEQYPRVAVSTLAGNAVMLGILGLYHLQPDGGLSNPVQSTLTLTALASVAGFGAGRHDARAKTRERTLEARNRELRETKEKLSDTVEQLREKNEQLEEFVGIVSHDLRNPLAAAQGRLELARTECNSDHLEAVERSHDRMETLIEDLLTLAKTGVVVSDTDRVVLADLSANVWQQVETDEAQLRIETEQVIEADPDRLRQLLENLLANAAEHGGDNVQVTLGALEGGFYVSDDGPGIPRENREEVFQAGYSNAADGTGFGLRIVEKVADAHDWTVAVTDSDAGGARFEITGVDVVSDESQ